MFFKVFRTTYSRVAFLFMRVFSLALLPSVHFSRPHIKPSAFVLPVSLEGSGCKRQLYIALSVLHSTALHTIFFILTSFQFLAFTRDGTTSLDMEILFCIAIKKELSR